MEPLSVTRAAGYVRNSTDKQEEANTHAAQISWLQEQARINGWQLTLYLEPGASGESIEGRPEMKRLLRDLKAGQFDVVAVRHIDRLCRSQGLADWATISEACKGAGVRIVASGLSLDLRDATQALMFNMMGPGISGFEKAMILARTKAGKERALREGRKPSGRDPYGLRWDKDSGKWSVVEAEAAAIQRIFELAAEGVSVRQIAKVCEEEGFRTRIGKGFQFSAIHKYLTASTYKGQLETNGATISVPAIVSEEVWDRANISLGNANSRAGRPAIEPNFLSRRLFCGLCGAKLYAINQRTTYVCGSHWAKDRKDSQKCTNGFRHRYRDINGKVWESFKQALTSPEFVERMKVQESVDDRIGKLLVEIESQRAKVESASAAAKRLALAMVNGGMDPDTWEVANAAATKALREDRAKLASLEAAIEAQKAEAIPSAAITVLETLASRLDRASELDKAEVASVLFRGPEDGVWVWPDRMEIRCIVPVPTAKPSSSSTSTAPWSPPGAAAAGPSSVRSSATRAATTPFNFRSTG